MLSADTNILGQAYDFSRRCLQCNPIILIGSGASISHGLPGMGELANEIRACSLPENLPSPAQKTWESFEAALEGAGLEQALDAANLWQIDALYTLVRSTTWRMIAERDSLARHLAVEDAKLFPCSDLFTYILNSTHHLLTIITTNYDCLIEYAAELRGFYVRTCFQRGHLAPWRGGVQQANFVVPNRPTPEKTVEILKVHGSIDWFRRKDNSLIHLPNLGSESIGLTPVIIPPSIRKLAETHDEPFRSTIAKADHRLTRGQGFFCIGYGFNDEHIQLKLVERAQNDHKPVVILAKALTPRARSIFIESHSGMQYLAVEQREGVGSMLYSHLWPQPVLAEAVDIWNLQHFIDTVL